MKDAEKNAILKGSQIKWMKLEEIAEIFFGDKISIDDLVPDGKYPVIGSSISNIGYINKFNREPETINIAHKGDYAGSVKFWTENFFANDECLCIKPNVEIILNKYLYFFLVSKKRYFQRISHGEIKNLKNNSILKTPIPIPPLEEQLRIISILDKFETMINPKEGLPREIELRQKQYEYYRDILLNFKI